MNPRIDAPLVVAAVSLGALASAALHGVTVRWLLRTPHARLALRRRRAVLVNAALGGSICGAVAWCIGPHPIIVAICYLAALAPVLATVDVAEQRLPNALTVGSYPVLIVLLISAAAATDDWSRLRSAAVGFIVLPTFYLVIAVVSRGGFGGGDIKLAGAAGLVLGYRGAVALTVGTVVALVIAALIGAALIVVGRADRRSRTPYGPALLVGALLAAIG